MEKWLIRIVIVTVVIVWFIAIVAQVFIADFEIPSTVHFCMMTIVGASATSQVLSSTIKPKDGTITIIDHKKSVRGKK